MIIPVFILFGVIASLFLFEQENATPGPLTLLSIFVSMVLISAFRDISTPDTGAYIYDFEGGGTFERFEVGYALIRDLLRLFTRQHVILFFVIAIISLSVKFRALYGLAPFLYGSLLVYLSNYFILHDMIQIRAGVASGLFLLGVRYITERRVVWFAVVTLFAICFHYSALLLIPLWFLTYKMPNRALWVWIIPISYILAFSHLTFSSYVEFIPYAPIQHLWEQYKMSMSDGVSEDVNIFNLVFLAKIAILTYLIFYIDLLKERYNHCDVWLWIYTLGVASFIIFSDVPVLAFRISELLNIVEIIIIPLIIYTLRYMIVSKLVVVVIALVFLLINVYHAGLLL